ncbi:hypothetical protein K6119_02460 [Paracrocinitomix mangrovi]|uniref:hypothetical protein n=1 Tax=Paracrocinitomix mangrovi TaxID=2862509 RepID=UPI001EDC1A3E|nr:hypothetical protein [Paracrocinitomix mangrovi]UKN02383.1 hypothetical protein K6119_02460 [Paracrocinitomix mangrovi]
MMLRGLIISIIIAVTHLSFAQRVRALRVNKDYEKYRISEHFDYLHDDFDSAKTTWVGDIRVEFDSIFPGTIKNCFNALKDRATKLGANGFKVTEADISSYGDNKYIEMSLYWIRMENRDENLVLHKSRDVYLFGFLGYHQEIDGYDVSIQNDEFVMPSLSFKKYAFKSKTDVTVGLGSKMRGAKTSFRIEEKMYPKFIYFKMISGSFKNAWIDEYPLSFGLFLTHILRKN